MFFAKEQCMANAISATSELTIAYAYTLRKMYKL